MENTFRVRKGAWTEEEDILLRLFIQKHGEGKWYQVPSRAGSSSTAYRRREKREREY
jgi:hypothetical protein